DLSLLHAVKIGRLNRSHGLTTCDQHISARKDGQVVKETMNHRVSRSDPMIRRGVVRLELDLLRRTARRIGLDILVAAAAFHDFARPEHHRGTTIEAARIGHDPPRCPAALQDLRPTPRSGEVHIATWEYEHEWVGELVHRVMLQGPR